MDLGAVMSIVHTLLATILCSEHVNQFCFLFGNEMKSDLESLRSTLLTISAVLRGAEDRRDTLCNQEKLYLEELGDVVYDVDDVFDELSTLVHQKNLIKKDIKFSDKVKSFFSKYKPVVFYLSRKVKEVQEKVNYMASKASPFDFRIDYQPIVFRKEKSGPYVFQGDVFGREEDVEKIVGMLLDSGEDHPDVRFLTIVGMGGLGKTALAQLVYNDPRVINSFTLRGWTCVADEDRQQWDLKDILSKVLAGIRGAELEDTTLDAVHRTVRAHLEGRKYLLVLDDVWTVDRNRWHELTRFLEGGLRGSRIVVTTRSLETAQIVGRGGMYMLQGLSEIDSWRLFEAITFDYSPSDEFMKIGKEILKQCSGVPLAIRAVGSLLHGQPKSRWESFQKGLHGVIGDDEHSIMPTLKLSYYNLPTPLKSCFTYCALLPKDSHIYKHSLIRLWMAQGYIIPEEGRVTEDVAEEYFLVLLRRCFFQDAKTDKDGNIVWCKMHDLMHDLAQEVVGNDICIVTGSTMDVDAKARHLGLTGREISNIPFKIDGLRTIIHVDESSSIVGQNFSLDMLLINCPCLRILDLHGLDLIILPESIGELLHLRWLDLSFNGKLERLPQALANLHNLQTLYLQRCFSLKEWPKDMSKLVNLATLDIVGCDGLAHMPMGLGKLTRLGTLGNFVVDQASGSEKQCVLEQLEELKPLNNLKGSLSLSIGVSKNVEYSIKSLQTRGGTYLNLKEHLSRIHIKFKVGEGYGRMECEEVLLDQLQPHPCLSELRLTGYHGVRMPRWLGKGVNFSTCQLSILEIRNCGELRTLSSLGRLPCLRELSIWNLKKVEYVEQYSTFCFPSLEQLDLIELPRLKRWWWSSTSPLVLPRLKSLRIRACPKFEITSLPGCPDLESLHLSSFASTPPLEPSVSRNYPQLKILTIENWKSFKSMPMNFERFPTLVIKHDPDVESFGETKDSFRSVQTLEISGCMKLRSVTGWIEYFSALETLRIEDCPNLVRNNEQEEEGGIPW